MAAPEVDSVDQNQTNPLVARRKKLDALKDLGVDPWGGRFEGHQAIASIRARLAEVVYRTEGGQDVPLPDFTAVEEGFNFRQWKADQGKGEMVGPQVRAAGRLRVGPGPDRRVTRVAPFSAGGGRRRRGPRPGGKCRGSRARGTRRP